MTEEDVRNAVNLAKMRDNQAITKLYEEYHNSVYFLCLRIVKDKDEAFDLVQNSFLAAFDKLSSLQKPECFGSWLHQIAANQCKNHLKKRQPLLFSEKQGDENIPEEFYIEDRDESLIPDQALDTRETRRLLMEIIDGLPDLQRMAVMLYYYEEQSIKEISVIMDCSENTVKSRLNYARKQIKAGVEDLEKKGTKLHGVFPMLFPLIRHAAADTSVPPEASTLMLKHIASSVNKNGATDMNGLSSSENTSTGPKARLWSAARNFAGKFLAMSLPVRIGSIAAALAIIAGVTVGVVAAVHAGSSIPVSCSVTSQVPSSKPQKRVISSAPVTAAVSEAVSSAPASSISAVSQAPAAAGGSTGGSTRTGGGSGGSTHTGGGTGGGSTHTGGGTGGGTTGGGTGGYTPAPAGISTRAYGANYGAEDQSEYNTIWRDACGVTGWSQYRQNYAEAQSDPDGFTACYGVPYSDAMNKALSIISCFPQRGGSPSTGNAYRAYTGQGTACGDVAKAREAALHAAGIPCRLVWSSTHMWIEFTVNGTTYQYNGYPTTGNVPGYSVAGSGYNYG